MAYTLDTAAATERIIAAGADPALARAIIAEVASADDAQRADLATRADLRALRSDLEAAIIASERRSLIAALAIAGVLFAALRLTG